MNKSKSIKEIYKEVKDFDLVITNDVVLASALNRNVTSPRLGMLSMTPRQLALKYGQIYFDKLYSKSELILEIYKHSKKPLKYIHQSVEKIFEIWNHTGLIESCELFLGQENELLKYFTEFKTVEFAMEKFDDKYYGNKKIAVAGFKLFNELDKQVLPRNLYPKYIELMTDEEFTFQKTYLFNSITDLTSSISTLINKENQNDVALIFNTDSELKNIFTSGLNQRGIKTEMKSLLKVDISVGKFLAFIESSFNISDHYVKDILFTESLFGINIDRKFSNFNITGYLGTRDGLRTFQNIYDLMSNIEDHTFTELFYKIEFISGKKLIPELRNVLTITELGQKKINSENFNILKYFILNFDIETGKSEDGVLFVNSSNAAFVDRPVTVFIGMDESWTRLNMDKAYIEKTIEEEKDLEKFQILLSQGEEKVYLALNIKKNQTVIPCYYFNMLSGKDIKGFEDDLFNPAFALIKPKSKVNIKSESHILNSDKPKMIGQISPSAMNSFYTCPKDFSYGKLIPQEEKSYFLKGTLLHDFAEFYFNHPEYCKKNFNKLLDKIIKKYSGFLSEINKEKEKTAFKIGMKVIMDFIDGQKFEYEIDIPEADTFKKAKGKSDRGGIDFFKESGLEKKYTNTEQWIKRSVACISGIIDLTSGQTIVDYKSSRSGKTENALINEYKIERLAKDKADGANFQTIAYIAGKREDNPDEEINFIYLYLLLNLSDYIKGIQDPDKSITTVKYIPETFKRYIISDEFYELLSTKHKVFTVLDHVKYSELIKENFNDIDFYNLDSISGNLEEKIHTYLTEEKGIDYTFFGNRKEETFRNKIIYPVFKELFKARTGTKDYPHIYKDEVDEFLIFAKETIKNLNECYKDDFPNSPVNDLRSVCMKCDYLNICIGNKLLTADEN
ncbi:MAG: PD-(D/E)XK nuclease family protein [Ignavibacteria bacterium]